MGLYAIDPEAWTDQSTFPGEHNPASPEFSIDVLVYSPDLDIHQIGFYEYSKGKWHFLCNEEFIDTFVWRYFNPEIDKPL